MARPGWALVPSAYVWEGICQSIAHTLARTRAGEQARQVPVHTRLKVD